VDMGKALGALTAETIERRKCMEIKVEGC